MVVQHNLTAMNSNRMLNLTVNAQAKSTEKLSSGYKINRAADDAAGLAISEKMRKQIRGLTRASENAQDGISAVQTAEGALNEVQDMLQRMNELSVQAANGTNSTSDRSALQDEINQLVTEIDRVSETTKFNETYLLKGNTDGTKTTQTVAAHDAGLAGTLTQKAAGKTEFKLDAALEVGDTVTIAGQEYTIGGAEAASSNYATVGNTTFLATAVSAGDTLYDDSKGNTYTVVDKVTNVAGSFEADDKISIDGTEYTIASGTSLTAGELSVADAVSLVADALSKGQEVKQTYDKGTTSAVDLEIVSALGTNEVSSVTATTATTLASAAGVTLAVGDTFNIGGASTRLVTNDTTIESSNVKDAIASLNADDTVAFGTQAYTVADETDAANKKFTTDDIIGFLKDYDNVTITSPNAVTAAALTSNYGITSGTAFTAVPDSTSTGTTISKAEAYSKMAKELAAASSIGADVAATVKNNNDGSFIINQGTVDVVDSLGFQLHVGADADMTNKITVDIASMSAAGLGVQGLNILDDTGAAGTYAIDAIADALQKVSDQRAALGAVQNRLEHTINNLDNVVENTTSAESQIRDTDMATEMVTYSNNNILAQAGQAMLAQANQSNQGVLSLLG